MDDYAQSVLELRTRQCPWETEFLQSVREVFESVGDLLESDPRYREHKILERLTIPERVVTFQVPFVADNGEFQVNTGYRVQFNSALGPYKGGLRFQCDVNLSVLKFLGFEQVFKNALTTLPLGGGKGGSDFDPRHRSDREIMSFCRSFMTGLYEQLGPELDIPAGDLGVGAREIGYLFQQYKRLTRRFNGVLTGKDPLFGGSLLRPEATGYGAVYFVGHMLARRNDTVSGKTVAISGFGNVAWGVARKLTELGAKVVTISGPDGYVLDEDGLDDKKIALMLELRKSGRDLVAPYVEKFPTARFFPGRKPWEYPVDIAMPCATQNELSGADATALIANRVQLVAEVSNMGCTPKAIAAFRAHKIEFAPGKAVNAGGVSVSGLEMAQNAGHIYWTESEIDSRLRAIMAGIFGVCVEYGRTGSEVDYVNGANRAAFKRVAEAMIRQGI